MPARPDIKAWGLGAQVTSKPMISPLVLVSFRRAIRLFLVSALFTAGCLTLASCQASRDAPTLRCSSQQQCPANGLYYCDVDAGFCRACVGACPWSLVDPDATSADIMGSSDTTSDVVSLSTDATSAVDVSSFDASKSEEDSEVGFQGSCVEHCGLAASDCFCNEACVNAGNCCDDYEQVCLADASTSTEAADAS